MARPGTCRRSSTSRAFEGPPAGRAAHQSSSDRGDPGGQGGQADAPALRGPVFLWWSGRVGSASGHAFLGRPIWWRWVGLALGRRDYTQNEPHPRLRAAFGTALTAALPNMAALAAAAGLLAAATSRPGADPPGHTYPVAARLRASTERATSSSSVDQLLTEMRTTSRSRHRDPDIHVVPSASRRWVTARVRSSSSKATQT